MKGLGATQAWFESAKRAAPAASCSGPPARAAMKTVCSPISSPTHRNMAFYERLGFRAQRALHVGDNPTITPMSREPNRAR